MPDLNQRHPQLATYLMQNTIWWVETAGLSGLRVDTLPVFRSRLPHAAGAIACSRSTRHSRSSARTGASIPRSSRAGSRARRRARSRPAPPPSLMDFPLQHAFVRGLTEPEGRETGLLRIYQALADDFLYADPNRLVVFPDNHDMSRIYTQLGASLERWKMAMAFFATVRGTPQFTWGSEILMANPGTDAHGVIRQDFPGAGRATRRTRRKARASRTPRAKRRITCAACSPGASPRAPCTAERSRSSRRKTAPGCIRAAIHARSCWSPSTRPVPSAGSIPRDSRNPSGRTRWRGTYSPAARSRCLPASCCRRKARRSSSSPVRRPCRPA